MIWYEWAIVAILIVLVVWAFDAISVRRDNLAWKLNRKAISQEIREKIHDAELRDTADRNRRDAIKDAILLKLANRVELLERKKRKPR